jgi:hypothetical protein
LANLLAMNERQASAKLFSTIRDLTMSHDPAGHAWP